MRSIKRKWESPTVRSYGTFETATKDGCVNKTLGSADGFLFQGDPITCAS